jgi:dTMP kinase
MTQGKFITLEGLDGAGKSTHIGWVETFLCARGIETLLTREPGGTPLGEKLRALLLEDAMHAETEALLMFAARREHLDKVIYPALKRGVWVVCDRFSDASFAYQGGGRGLPEARLARLEDWVHGGFQPDLTLLFDVPVAVSRARLAANVSLDRFEQERAEFFQRVRAAYLERAQRHPERIRVVDAARPLVDIQQEIVEILKTLS